MKVLCALLLLNLFSYCYAEDASEKNIDPWQGLNRVTHRFNNTADKILLKPFARAYLSITPKPIRAGVLNFFTNLYEINNGVNNVLQGKPVQGGSDFLRLLVNTTVGIGGLFDPASKLGLEKHNESFGQTLTVWGLPTGPYVVLPLFGPRTLTDALVGGATLRLDPIAYYHPVADRNILFAVRALDERANLIALEGLVFGDKYIFMRDAYLQHRNYLVQDGVLEDDFDDF